MLASIDEALKSVSEVSAILESVQNIVDRSSEGCGEDIDQASQMHCAGLALKRAAHLVENADGPGDELAMGTCLLLLQEAIRPPAST